ASVWDGTVPRNEDGYTLSGSGTEADPYLIQSANDLAFFARCTNNGVNYAAGTFLKLTCDIVINSDHEDYMDWITTPPQRTLPSISKNGNSFKGVLDGGGHVIYGLYSVDNTNTGWKDGGPIACGFFGYLMGTVKNLGFEHCVTVRSAENTVGAGIIASYLGKSGNDSMAVIENCYVKDCYVSSWRVAGLIAGSVANAKINNCYAIGTVAGGRNGEADIGGLVGYARSAASTIENVYVLATMSLASGSSVVGSIAGNSDKAETTIDNVYFDSTVSGQTKAIGYSKSGGTQTDMKKENMTVESMSFSSEVWQDVDGSTPVLSVFAPHVHTPGEPVAENASEGTCTNGGTYEEVVYCTGCGEELSWETKTVAAEGHKASEAVKENEVSATCTSEGSYDDVVYCSVCGEEISRTHNTVPVTEHTPAKEVRENVVEAEVGAEGSYDEVVYCSKCGTELSRTKKTTPALEFIASVWDGVTPRNEDGYTLSGSGTESDPYLINNANDLAFMLRCTNNGISFSYGTYFKLTTDIIVNANFSKYMTWLTNAPSQQLPSGSKGGSSFKGVFDGNGHIIYGAYYVDNDATGWGQEKYLSGFFGRLEGTVKNLGFINCVVIRGEGSIGAGIITSRLGRSGNDNPAVIENCFVADSYVSAWRCAGLLCGIAENAEINNCYSTGIVAGGRADESDMGGLIGYCRNNGKLSNAYSLAKLDLVEGSSVNGALVGNCDNVDFEITNLYFDSARSGSTKAFGYFKDRDYSSAALDVSAEGSTIKLRVSDMKFSSKIWANGSKGPVLKMFSSAATSDYSIVFLAVALIAAAGIVAVKRKH
ncbi:MAG: hypothetical protein J5563_07055, partial [Clostridia bacterium]|nr:hypothetical protein [Clostridia bacterium]